MKRRSTCRNQNTRSFVRAAHSRAVGVFVDYHRHLARHEIERHIPWGRHDIGAAACCTGHEYRWAMVEEAIRFGQLDRSPHLRSQTLVNLK